MMAEKNMNGRGQTYEMGTQWMFAPILFCIAAATSTEIAAAIGCGCIIAYILNNLIARARVHIIRKRLGWRLNLAEMVIK
jgi:hypothetical protein